MSPFGVNGLLNHVRLLLLYFSVWQGSRIPHRDYCLSNVNHLIGIGICDYFGMQTDVAIWQKFRKLCGHPSVAVELLPWQQGSKEADRWRQRCCFCRGKAAFCPVQGHMHLQRLVSRFATCEIRTSQTPASHVDAEISADRAEFGSSLPVSCLCLPQTPPSSVIPQSGELHNKCR